jgi:hypothetical protein
MAYAQSDLDRLDAAIASGVLVVKYADGSTVTYRSLDELRTARGIVAAAMTANASQTRGNPRVSLATFE